MVFDSLIWCRNEVPSKAMQKHHMMQEMLRDQPTFAEVWPQLAPLLARPLVVYNAAFDIPMLAYQAISYDIRMAPPASSLLDGSLC
jgi:DNA polymerase III epsilon subunit-like protein